MIVTENNGKPISATSKIQYWQYIRAICIVLVVLIHSQNGIEFENGALSWNYHYWLIQRAAINFPVAFFIFLSAYFTKKARVREKSSSAHFLLKRTKRLAIPYLIWSSIYMLISIVLDHTESINLFKTIAKVALGLSSGQLYFVLVLIQLTILSPLLARAVLKKRKWVFLITPFYLVIVYGYQALWGSQLPFYQTFFPAWVIFYYAGLWVQINGLPECLSKRSTRFAVTVAVFALLLSIVETYVLRHFGFTNGFISSQIKFTAFFYAFAVINLAFSLKNLLGEKTNRLLSALGGGSFGIYFVHMIWIQVFGNALSYIPGLSSILPLFQVVQVSLTMLLSYGSIVVTRRIIGSEAAGSLLGI